MQKTVLLTQLGGLRESAPKATPDQEELCDAVTFLIETRSED